MASVSVVKDKRSTQKFREQSEDKSKEHLLSVALELFAAKGYDGVTVREIAKHSGLNLSMISYYFGGKEGLYNEILDRLSKNFGAMVHTVLANVHPEKLSEDQFRFILSSITESVMREKIKNPCFVKLISRERLEGMPNIKKAHEDFFDQLGESLVQLFTIGKKRGFLHKDLDPYVFFLLVLQALDGYLIMRGCRSKFIKKSLALESEEDLKEFVKQFNLIFIDGIIKR